MCIHCFSFDLIILYVSYGNFGGEKIWRITERLAIGKIKFGELLSQGRTSHNASESDSSMISAFCVKLKVRLPHLSIYVAQSISWRSFL